MNNDFYTETDSARFINYSHPRWIAATKREKTFWQTLLFTPPQLRSRQQKKHALSYNQRRATESLSQWRI